MRHILLISCIALAYMSCNGQTNKQNNSGIKNLADSLNTSDNAKKTEAILIQISGKGQTIPKGASLNVMGFIKSQITNIKILDNRFSKSENVKNPKNKLNQSETYFAINIQYVFSDRDVKEYDSSKKILTSNHIAEWYLVDEIGKYFRVLTNLDKSTNGTGSVFNGQKITKFFDGNNYSPAYIPSQVNDGELIKETILFKLPITSHPIKLIYLNKFLGDNYESIGFEL